VDWRDNASYHYRADNQGTGANMRSLMSIAIVLIAMSTSGVAIAQNYIVTTPGQPSTFVNRNPIGGGYTITTPGQSTTFVNPNPYGGGYTVTTPGQPNTYVNPTPGGQRDIYNRLMRD
jgi:hypothetical protein